MMDLPRIVSTDEPGEVLATFVPSSSSSSTKRTTSTADHVRVDIIPPSSAPLAIIPYLRDTFLPLHYPHSVTPDYTPYQIYDSLQALLSTIAGLLSSRAALLSLGVGDASATASGAVLLNIAQDALSRLATIVFAARVGPALSPEAKRWRLAADVFNDAAMVVECACPALPPRIRVLGLAVVGVCRALCGVAAGSAKASLSAHFARGADVGELNAKDASQETVVGLVGMVLGTWVVGRVEGTVATWGCLLVLLTGHLWANWMAVKAVQMRTLNRQRLGIVAAAYWDEGTVMGIRQVAERERVFEWDGMVRDIGGGLLGWCTIGVGFNDYVTRVGSMAAGGHSGSVPRQVLVEAGAAAACKGHLLHVDGQGRAWIALAQGCGVKEQARAWITACRALQLAKDGVTPAAAVRKAESDLADRIDALWQDLRIAGWDTDVGALETQKPLRFGIAKD